MTAKSQMTSPIELDPHDLPSRYANHVGHFLDRLDSSYAELTLKDHGDALLKAKVMILAVFQMRKAFNEPELGSEARRFEHAFDGTDRGRVDPGNGADTQPDRPIDWDTAVATPDVDEPDERNAD